MLLEQGACHFEARSCSSRMGEANAATEGGGKYLCPVGVELASETEMQAFSIVDTPYHAYGPGTTGARKGLQ